MRILFYSLICAVLLIGAYLFFGGTKRSTDLAALSADAERGAYVLRLGGCVTCHTRPARGKLMGGGGPLATEFGTFYGPNVTPHPEDGIGNWSLADFADALFNGHSKRVGPLFPVFPFPAYGRMSDQDVVDLWAHMKTLEPAAGGSLRQEPNKVWVMRSLMRPWKTLFHQPGEFTPDLARDALWNRGRYIVEGVGHCADCHTPRNAFGALDRNRLLEGAKLPPENEKVPAITPEALKTRGYTKADLMMALQFGLTPDGDVLGGSMGEVLSDQLRYLTHEDLEAIATYLMDGGA